MEIINKFWKLAEAMVLNVSGWDCFTGQLKELYGIFGIMYNIDESVVEEAFERGVFNNEKTRFLIQASINEYEKSNMIYEILSVILVDNLHRIRESFENKKE